MLASRAVIEQLVAEGATVYGVTTGFGDLANVRIEPGQVAELQRNLVRSHTAGVGDPLPVEVVRAMLLLRANALAIGLSGVRPDLAELLCGMLNESIHPVIPSRGSVGASGDLAPLAHLAAVMIGEGEADTPTGPMAGAEALSAAGLVPLELGAKEGLALLNGTQLMTAIAALVLHDGRRLAASADVIGAMSLEAMEGTGAAFDEELIGARPHPGQVAVAAHLRALLLGSQIGASHAESPHRLQDAYSLRCMPQVHGAVRDALDQLERVVTVEMNAVTDNPLVFADGRVVSGGNFHGEPMALAIDYAKIALAELASISERRTARLVDAISPACRRSCRRAGPAQRADDRAVHRRVAGQRDADADPSVVGRHDPDQRQPGGPRQHGCDRCAPPVGGAGFSRNGARHRGAVRRPGTGLPGTDAPGGRPGPRARQPAESRSAHLAEDRSPAPDIAAKPATCCIRASLLAAADGG